MEPACSLRENDQLNTVFVTFICQETKEENLRSTDTGLSTLLNAANLRQTFKDPNSRTTEQQNILPATHSKAERPMKWHKTYYSTFTNKSHLERPTKSQTTITSTCSNIVTSIFSFSYDVFKTHLFQNR